MIHIIFTHAIASIKEGKFEEKLNDTLPLFLIKEYLQKQNSSETHAPIREIKRIQSDGKRLLLQMQENKTLGTMKIFIMMSMNIFSYVVSKTKKEVLKLHIKVCLRYF